MRKVFILKWLAATVWLWSSVTAHADADATLAAKIQEITQRVPFKDSKWGMKFYALDTKKTLYSLNSQQLFVAGSAFKLFIEGTAFSTLGPDYRFHTPIYRTGPIVNGVLKGDLVLVASGDLMISSRLQPDGTLIFPEPDHSYANMPGAAPIPGDPLQVIEKLAAAVASKGIKRIEGRVLVDASLFRADRSKPGIDVNVTTSPMMINDNMVDVTVLPGSKVGDAAELRPSPQTDYVQIINEVKTVAAGTRADPSLKFVDDVLAADGTHTVTLTGEISLGTKGFAGYYIPEPDRFAQRVLARALRHQGIEVNSDPLATTDFATLSRQYTAENLLAEHVSLPLYEEVKGMLKVSSNLHTAAFPYIIGALAGHDRKNAKAVGEAMQDELFKTIGLDPNAGLDKSNYYGSSGPPGAFGPMTYTSEFFVTFLDYMARQPYFLKYRAALPIMGKDGSTSDVQPHSPAAGHVYAKTGTGFLGKRLHKALAGYIELPDRRLIAFAAFMNFDISEFSRQWDAMQLAGDALGEIVTNVYVATRENRAH